MVIVTSLIASWGFFPAGAAHAAGRAGGSRIVFAIGRPDGSGTEFALQPDGYARYGGEFPGDVLFIVGKSLPGRDWPYIHPGPADAWAGSTEHDFTVEFTAQGKLKGDLLLTVDFVDTHPYPPQYSIDLNAETRLVSAPKGEGRAYAGAVGGKADRIQVLFPAAVVKKGANRLTLKNFGGSWAVYDCLQLEHFPDGLPNRLSLVEVKPLPLFPRENGRVRQTVQLTLDNLGAETEASVAVEYGGEVFEQRLGTIGFGKSKVNMELPEIGEGTEVTFVLKDTGGRPRGEKAVRWASARKWTVYLAHHSHTDLGYTNVQSEVRKIHTKNIAAALDYAAMTGDWPAEAKYVWTVETSWALASYLDDLAARPAEERAKEIGRLKKAAAAGQLGVEGLYLNMLYSLCGVEELARQVYPASLRLAGELGIKPETAMLTDVPGISWSAATVMAKAGLKYLDLAPNDVRLTRTLLRPALFYWIGPDGKSRILTFIHVDPPVYTYHEGNALGFTDSLETAAEELPRRLMDIEAAGWPYDIYQMRVQGIHPSGRYIDNTDTVMTPAMIVKEWNEKYAYPRLVMGTNQEFFADAEARYGRQLPSFAGDLTDWWVDGAASSAKETGMSRVAQDLLPAAEKLAALTWALDPGSSYPAAEIKRAYENLILYHEHTWGSDDPRPENPAEREQWANKAGMARDALAQSQSLLNAGAGALVSALEPAASPSIIAINPLSWTRTDVAEAVIDRAALLKARIDPAGFALLDEATGDRVRFQVSDGGDGKLKVVFVAGDVPAMGYRSYRLAKEEGAAAPAGTASRFKLGQGTLENRYFKVVLDPGTGAIKSIHDKELDRELVDPSADYQMNQYIHRIVAGNHDYVETAPENVRVATGESGPVRASLIVTWSGKRHPAVRQEIILYHELKRIDLINTVTKDEIREKEAAYFSFPIHIADCEPRFESQTAVVRYFRDQLPGSALDYQAMSHWADLSNAEFGVSLASREAPLIKWGEIEAGPRIKGGSLTGPGGAEIDETFRHRPRGTIFSYVMNNAWDVNYRLSQGGELRFAYSLQPHKGGYDRGAATLFGWGYANPLVAVAAGPGSSGGRLPRGAWSFLRLTSAPGGGDAAEASRLEAVVTTLKRAEDGRDLVVRLFGLENATVRLSLNLPGVRIIRAHLADIVERTGEELPVKDNAVLLPVAASDLFTVRLVLE